MSRPPAANVSSRTHGIVISDGPVSQVKPPSRICPARPPGRGALLEHGDVRARALQPQRRRQPAQPCADDDRSHRRCPPQPGGGRAPAAHVATRSCAITVATASARPVGLGRDQERPRRARPRPRRAPGTWRRRRRRAARRRRSPAARGRRARRLTAAAVGTPQSPNAAANGAGARCPAGPRSAPSSSRPRRRRRRRRPRAAERRHVGEVQAEADLLDDDRPRREPGAMAAMPSITPAKSGWPSGWTASCTGLRWMVSPSASSRSTSRSRAPARRAAHLRGAEVRQQQRRPLPAGGPVGGSRPGSSSSGRPEPSTSAIPCSAAAAAAGG